MLGEYGYRLIPRRGVHLSQCVFHERVVHLSVGRLILDAGRQDARTGQSKADGEPARIIRYLIYKEF
jgi:hypothetical protein